jgi:signal transduction histidine kinase
LIVLAVGVFAAWQAHLAQKDVSSAWTASAASIRAAEELAIRIRDIKEQCHLFVITGEQQYLNEALRLRETTDPWLAQAERNADSPRGAEQIAHVKIAYQRFFENLQRIAEPHLANDASTKIKDLTKTLFNEMEIPAQDYLDITEVEIARRSDEHRRVAERTAIGLLLLGVCGLIAGLLAGYGIARQFHRSIVRLSVAVSDTAGKLEGVVGPLTLTTHWGLEELEVAMRAIAQRIGAVVERLQESQREAQRSKELATLGQLAAGYAHELRNGLMPMKILVQAALTRSPAPILDGADLSVLVAEITRLERAVQALLDFAKPSRPNKQLFDVRTVVRETANLIEGRAHAIGAAIDLQLPDGPVLLLADAGQIRQVIFNLILNALDAVAGGGDVFVELLGVTASSSALGEDGQHRVILRVLDTGCGLPAELGSRIFDPFVSTKETGVGLGLCISKRIIEDHGGTISCSNRPEGGAVFTVELPARFQFEPVAVGETPPSRFARPDVIA